MKIRYDKETDILTITLRDAPIADSDQGKRGAIVDYDADGELVAIEVVDASRLLDNPAALAVG
jgi:uncharacterized protein YuzE